MKAHVLVVEDNPQNLKLSRVILEAAGYQVSVAQTSFEADAAIALRTPDLILMDLSLPGKDGYTLTRELRQRPATARLPILALSSYAMPGDAERALTAGCTAYLTKPTRRALLLEQVAQLLREASGSHGSDTPAGTAPETQWNPSPSSPPGGVA
jgi:two-component system, cell cycle response regulator DivK